MSQVSSVPERLASRKALRAAPTHEHPTGTVAIVVQLWFDFSCPYAYLASRRAHTLGVTIDWRPMLLGGVFRGIGAGDGPMAKQSPQKAGHNYADMHRWADVFGAAIRMPEGHPMRTVHALRVLLALPHEHWPPAIEAIFAAYWQ